METSQPETSPRLEPENDDEVALPQAEAESEKETVE